MATVSLRDQMPLTARWIDERRAQYGKEHVNDCIRRALAGEPGRFYAIEQGHVLGTPFPPGGTDPQGEGMAYWQRYAIVAGLKFAAFIATPPGVDGEYAAISAGEHAVGTH